MVWWFWLVLDGFSNNWFSFSIQLRSPVNQSASYSDTNYFSQFLLFPPFFIVFFLYLSLFPFFYYLSFFRSCLCTLFCVYFLFISLFSLFPFSLSLSFFQPLIFHTIFFFFLLIFVLFLHFLIFKKSFFCLPFSYLLFVSFFLFISLIYSVLLISVLLYIFIFIFLVKCPLPCFRTWRNAFFILISPSCYLLLHSSALLKSINTQRDCF